jgi:hypothetical protein
MADTPLTIKSVMTYTTTKETIYKVLPMKPNQIIRSTPEVTVEPNHLLTVQGIATAGAVVGCTLVRLGSDKSETHETIAPTTRFAKATTLTSPATPNWKVVFEVRIKGKYLVGCHSGTFNDYVEVVIATVNGAQLQKAMSMDNSYFNIDKIGGHGSVFYPGNPVFCTLTPIHPDDGTTSGASLTDFVTPDQTNPTQWYVAFDADPGSPFSGWYVLAATAGNEGTVSSTGQAMQHSTPPPS